ncbi:MAG: pyridoxal phosphate-dependent aminotransferase [Desulfobacterales bacterium]|nr:pyridoxal phosphate-dependent aminotransferase [Desulfobacterales bacterium]
MKLSNKIQSIKGSQTVSFTSLIARLRRDGKRIIDFAVGEPQFDTPSEIIESTKKALAEKNTRYGPIGGLPQLQVRLAAQFSGYDADNILISNGSKQALFMIFQVICDPLNEVIIPTPFWVSFAEQVKMAGGRPIFVPTKDHQLDCEEIERAITHKTKAILINSPNNPTGAVYSALDLKKVARLAMDHDLFIVADEAYDAFVYDDITHCSMHDIENISNQTIVTRSFSKNYSMTGFRVGYVAASKTIIAAISKLQSHLSGNVCTFAQYGALTALSLDESFLSTWRSELQRKRDIAYQYVTKLFGCVKPQGAFYLFPDVSIHLKDDETSGRLTERLLEKANVAVVPGEAFGMANHLRISFAVSEENLRRGFEQISEVL